MDRYIKALQDVLLVLIAIGSIVLLVSVVSSSESGASEFKPRVGAFLEVDYDKQNDEPAVVVDQALLGENIAASTPQEAVTSAEEPDSSPQEPAAELKDEEQSEPTVKITEDTVLVGSSTYVIKKGDTFGCIAEAYYGSYEHWQEISALNTGVGFQEHRLFVGYELTLPAATSVKPISSLCN